jgi:hypothetical protein
MIGAWCSAIAARMRTMRNFCERNFGSGGRPADYRHSKWAAAINGEGVVAGRLPARSFADPDAAARKLVEIANAAEAVQDGRIAIELINLPFLQAGGTAAEYRSGIACAISKCWLWQHESGGNVTSVIGTFRTCRAGPATSAFRGKPEVAFRARQVAF